MCALSVAAVVLAAGASTRLGRPKQTLVFSRAFGGEMLVERAVRAAYKAGLSPVIVVVRAEASFAELLRGHGCAVVINEYADEGMAASIRCGVSNALGADGVVLMSCDQVTLRAEHLRALCAVPGQAAGSRYAGHIGIPAYFPAAMFVDLMELKGDVGAREMLHGAVAIKDETLALDIDTEADVELARIFVEQQQS